MKTFKFFLSAIAFLFCINLSSAQEMQAEKHENLEWYVISFFKWEDGKEESAKKIINEYFKPSATDVGHEGPVMELDLLFGDWDHMVVFPMDEGLEDLEWKTSPADLEWLKAFNQRVGGEEKGRKVFEEFSTYIKDSKSQLARKSV